MSFSTAQTNSRLEEIFRTGIVGQNFHAENLLKNKKVVVYGAGNGYLALRHTVLDRLRITPALVLDNKFSEGQTFDGIAARSLAGCQPSAADTDSSVVVVTVGGGAAQDAIRQQLQAAGYSRVINASDLYEFNIHHVPGELQKLGRDFYPRQRHAIAEAFSLFSDPESQEVFLSVLRRYVSHAPVPIPHQPPHDQYFPTDIALGRGYARFIHCGAYDGDTVRQLQKRLGKIEALACFEPDPKNFCALAAYLREHGNEIAAQIVAFPCGVLDREAQLPFSGGRLLSSSLFDPGTAVIPCVSLDDVLPHFQPTFISMDIEGAEPQAIGGAARLIGEARPDLAISVYHFPQHLWEIPLILQRRNLGYRFFLRNYSGFTYETILYATEK